MVADVSEPWNVDDGEVNQVSFEFELADKPVEEFSVVATNCGSDDSYSITSSDDVSDMTVTFRNTKNIIDTQYCVVVALTWDNGEEVQEVASLDYTLEVEATESDTETVETETPETSIQVVEQVDDMEMTVVVTRPNPPITLAVTNEGPIFFGQDVIIEVTSLSAGYEFQLTGARTSSYELQVVEAGPGPSGVNFAVNGFSINDFAGPAITLILDIMWDADGFGNIGGNGRRNLQPNGKSSQRGTITFELQIETALPGTESHSSSPVRSGAQGPLLLSLMLLTATIL